VKSINVKKQLYIGQRRRTIQS